MYIGNIAYMPTFRATAGASSKILLGNQQNFIAWLRAQKLEQLQLDKIDPTSKETLFQLLVDADYIKPIQYIAMKGPQLLKNVINRPNSKGLLPWETASDGMKLLLENNGAVKSLSELADANTASDTSGDDARDVAARVFLTDPGLKKVQAGGTGAPTDDTDYWDAFAQVDSNAESEQDQIPVVSDKSADSTKAKVTTFNTTGICDCRILEITENDVLCLDDLIGRKEIIEELKANIIAPLKNNSVSQTLKKNKVDLPNGILFEAPYGGETTIIKALSNESGIPAVILEDSSDLDIVLTGLQERHDAGLKTIILAQGFDSYFSNCTTCDNTKANAFKNKINGIGKLGGIFIATTVDKEKVRPEFKKSGIIDKIIEVPKPTESDRAEFFKRHFADKDIFKAVNNNKIIQKMVRLTDNRSYADLMRLLDETARTALSNRKKVDMEAFETQLASFSKELNIVPINEENRTASYDVHIKRIPIAEGEPMSFDELGSMSEITAKLRELYVDRLKDLDNRVEQLGNNAMADGSIFYGPPGNGKSTVARVLARELGIPYYEIKRSDIASPYVNETVRKFAEMVGDLKKKFHEDPQHERSVLFLDELDSIGATRDGQLQQHDTDLVTTLLQQLDNPAKNGIIVIAATNNVDDIDSALIRRGRIGNKFMFTNPNQEEREDIIKKEFMKMKITKEFANDSELISKIAKELDGFSRANIVYVIADAANDYYKDNTDFEASIKRALDKNLEDQISQFCKKSKLQKFKYDDLAFQSLDELGGMSDVVAQLRDQVISVWDPEIRQVLLENRRMPSGGFMLEGPPGGGKTTLIETLAKEMGISLYKMSYDDKDAGIIYQLPRILKEIFENLALESKVTKKPVMLFFDEAENFFPIDARDYKESEVATLKQLMNDAAKNGIILAGATNHIDRINKEIIGNPRRMGTVIHCGEPNYNDRIDILTKMLSRLSIVDGDFTEKDIQDLASATDKYTIGDISKAVDAMLLIAAKKKVLKKTIMTPKEFVMEFIEKY